jgi:hypothetical protein
MSLRDAAACLETAASVESRIRLWKRWEQGKVRPSSYYTQQLAVLLDVPESDLLPASTVDAVDRRQFLAAALVGIATVDDAATVDGVDGLERVLGGLRDIEEALGPRAAIQPAEVLCGTAEMLARSAPAHHRNVAVSRVSELYSYAGHLRTLAEDWAEAQRLLDRATTAGMESGDSLALAHALGKSSALAFDRGELNSADSLALASIRAGAGSHPLATYTYMRASVAALVGDRLGTRQLLTQAERAAEALSEPSPTMPWSNSTYYAAASAMVLHRSGDPAAPALMADALTAFPERWRRSAWARRYLMVAGESS